MTTTTAPTIDHVTQNALAIYDTILSNYDMGLRSLSFKPCAEHIAEGFALLVEAKSISTIAQTLTDDEERGEITRQLAESTIEVADDLKHAMTDLVVIMIALANDLDTNLLEEVVAAMEKYDNDDTFRKEAEASNLAAATDRLDASVEA